MSSLLEQLRAALAPQYEVEGELASGGMGAVFVARDVALDRRVAVKTLRPDIATDTLTQRLRREARTLAKLNHPNIVPVYAAGDAEGHFFYVMDYVEGETLKERLARGKMSADEARTLAAGLLDALGAAHERGIVHRDVKPSNVFLVGDRVLLGDFGIAKHVEDATRDMTAPGQQVGTPGYMPPEQAAGEASVRTDIYATGMVLYEALTGRRWQVLKSTGETDWSGVPAQMAPAIRRALAWSPEARWPSAEAFRRALLSETRAAARAPAGVVPATMRSAKRRALVGGVVAVVVMSVGAWWFWGGPGRERTGIPTLELPTGPVIAVLPFANRGDPSQEFFADGISEEIITALTRFDEIFILARNTTFQFKGQAVDVRRVGQELGARYVLEGSLQRAESRVRVTVQLLDAETGTHLWADTYDRDLTTADIFDLINDITSRVVGVIADAQGVIARTEGLRARATPPEDLAAYECVLRAHHYWTIFTRGLHAEVRTCLEGAVEREPFYAEAWAWLSIMATDEYRFGFNPRPEPLERATAAAREAVRLAPSSEVAYQALAYSLFYSDDLGAFFGAAERALDLNPNNPQVIASLGLHFVYAGDSERGLALIRKAAALNPQHPGWYYFPSMYYYYGRGEYERALTEAKRLDQDIFWRPAWLAAIYGQLGRGAEAQSAVAELLRLRPTFRSSVREDYRKVFKRPPEGLDRFLDGLQKAGLEIPPEEPDRDG